MQSNNIKKRNFWPYGIAISIILVAIMCADMVRIALANPVHMDNYYFTDYRNVDENINKIIESKKIFDDKYLLDINFKEFTSKNNKIKIKLTDKNTSRNIETAKIQLLITRPDVSTFDKKPKFKGIEDGYYVFEPFDIQKKGRWQIMVKVDVDKLASFTKLETYAVIQ